MRVSGLVSIIVPIYNAERFLREALESVLAQTYTHWELLLIDDGSTDESSNIAKEYAASDPNHIRCLEHPGHRNFGMCAARNLGVRNSRGEYVALLDADDVWLDNKLEQQVCLMKAHPEAGLVYGHSIYFDEGRAESTERVPQLAPSGKLYSPPDLLLLTYPLGQERAPCPSTFLMRYELLEEMGGFEEIFDPEALYEDSALLTKFYLRASVFIDEKPWIKYRVHQSSCLQRGLRNGAEDRMRKVYGDWLQNYLRQKGIQDRKVWVAVQRFTWPYRHPVLSNASRFVRRGARRLRRLLQ
jgi:glycosyltransferase involved in cell wall biosynthesis